MTTLFPTKILYRNIWKIPCAIFVEYFKTRFELFLICLPFKKKILLLED